TEHEDLAAVRHRREVHARAWKWGNRTPRVGIDVVPLHYRYRATDARTTGADRATADDVDCVIHNRACGTRPGRGHGSKSCPGICDRIVALQVIEHRPKSNLAADDVEKAPVDRISVSRL